MTVSDRREPLPAYLRRLRQERKLSLRAVEKITGGRVSNGYLSQLEGGLVDSPGILILHTLSAAYGVDFQDLCAAACVENRPPPSPTFCPTCGAVMDDLIRRGI